MVISRSPGRLLANMYSDYLFLLVFAAWLWPAVFAADNPSGYIPAWPNCSKTDNYTTNSQYQLNLNQLLNILPTEAKNNGGFYNASLGAGPDDGEVFALIMCYADRNWTQCVNCLYGAVSGRTLFCPYSRMVDAAYDTCLLRYSNSSFFSVANTNLAFYFYGNASVADVSGMYNARWTLIYQLMEEAGGSPLRMANGSKAYTDSEGTAQVMYGLAQCTRDLIAGECIRCLKYSLGVLPYYFPNNISGGIKLYSCYVLYDLNPFELIQLPPPAPSPSSSSSLDSASPTSTY